jgi:hypothetical protein
LILPYIETSGYKVDTLVVPDKNLSEYYDYGKGHERHKISITTRKQNEEKLKL